MVVIMRIFAAHLMKNNTWLILVAALVAPLAGSFGQPVAPPDSAPLEAEQGKSTVPVKFSPGAAEVVRLAESGVTDDVILAYITNSQVPFSLSAEDVLYLKDVGLSPEVTTAMLNHDSGLRGQALQNAPAAVNRPSAQPVATSPAPAVEAPLTPPPQVEAAAPTYVSNAPADVGYFYNDLSPYGTWVVLDGIGWCWQPRTVVISRGWRPYCDGGRWVYSDCGWFWQSDYSWGWAPFHYGRWQLHARCGWVWTPDRVWGPAWVTWRVAGNNCGWAPLPPRAVFEVGHGWRFNGVRVSVGFDFGLGADHFTFVGVRDFDRRDLGHRRLAPVEVRNIYRKTTIINNYTVVNNRIVNHGLPVDRVTSVTHRELQRASVRDIPAGTSRPARGGATERGGGAVVYRRELAAPARSVKAVAQRVDDRHPVIQHTAVASTSDLRGRRSFGSSGSAPASIPSGTHSENRRDFGSANSDNEAARSRGNSRAGAYGLNPAPGSSQAPKQPAPSPIVPRVDSRRTDPSSRAITPVAPNKEDKSPWSQNQGRSTQAVAPSQDPRVFYPKGHAQLEGVRPSTSYESRNYAIPSEGGRQRQQITSPPSDRSSGEKTSDRGGRSGRN